LRLGLMKVSAVAGGQKAFQGWLIVALLYKFDAICNS
jgi:hypothetical protein